MSAPVAEPLPDLHGIAVMLLEDNGDFRDAMEAILRLCGAHTNPVSSLAEAREADRGGALAVVAVTAFPHYVPPARATGFAVPHLCSTVASLLGRGDRAAPER